VSLADCLGKQLDLPFHPYTFLKEVMPSITIWSFYQLLISSWERCQDCSDQLILASDYRTVYFYAAWMLPVSI